VTRSPLQLAAGEALRFAIKSAGLTGRADGNIGGVAEIDPPADALVGDWLSLTAVAERLGLTPSRIKQLLHDHKLLAVRRPDGSLCVPAALLEGNHILKGLQGTLTLLFDCGFAEAEALRWLFTADDTLSGTPIQAMVEHRRAEVNRRAQALAF
jgi:transcriptional regulator with XRE-family HTH domain